MTALDARHFPMVYLMLSTAENMTTPNPLMATVVSGSARFKKRTRTLNPRLSGLVPFPFAGAQLAAQCLALISGLVCCVVGILIDLCSKHCPFVIACTMWGCSQNRISFASDGARILLLFSCIWQTMTATCNTSRHGITSVDSVHMTSIPYLGTITSIFRNFTGASL